MGGGAWPFLVGGVICLVNSVNERDPSLLKSAWLLAAASFLEGLRPAIGRAWGNNRSVMPLDVLGAHGHTDACNEHISCPRGHGQSLNSRVLGIDHCNCWSCNEDVL